MKQFASLLLGSTAALALSGTAQANYVDSNHGWYIGIEGGAVWLQDLDFDINSDIGVLDDLDGDVDFDKGWGIIGTVGYGFWRNWRAEFELGFRSNDVDSVTLRDDMGDSVTLHNLDASFDETTLMFNVLYDWRWSERWGLSLGAGIGADHVDIDRPDFGLGNDDDDDFQFAFQVIAGLSYALTPRTDLVFNYRYLHADSPDVHLFNDTRVDFDDLSKHTVTVGLRFDLSPELVAVPAPPPPPPPVVPVVPVQPVVPAPPPVAPPPAPGYGAPPPPKPAKAPVVVPVPNEK